MQERTGGCLRRAIRYRLIGAPTVSRICWCRDCQHLAGNGTANAFFPTEAIEVLQGSPSNYVSVADSGNSVRRRFCQTCGSHLSGCVNPDRAPLAFCGASALFAAAGFTRKMM